MIIDRKQQLLILNGKVYSAKEIHEMACKIKAGVICLPADYAPFEKGDDNTAYSSSDGTVKESGSKLPSARDLVKDIESKDIEAYRDLFLFLEQWFDDSSYIRVHTSGSTGKPKEQFVEKDRMTQSACMTGEYLQLQSGDTALLCMNLRYIGAMMMVVRSLVFGLNLTVCSASGHPLKNQPAIRFTAMVPLQVYNTLLEPDECTHFKDTGIVLIGGGPVSPELEEQLKSFPNAIYSTYGMTETLSHIALRRLSGPSASQRYYPFQSVQLSLSPDNTLQIDAPRVVDGTLQTNDIARIYQDGSFTILGRKDNTINTGGVKVQIEQLEKKLSGSIPMPFAITSTKDPKLGEKIILLLEAEVYPAEIEAAVNELLSPYERPKQIMCINKIPLTENGKTDRAECKRIAEEKE